MCCYSLQFDNSSEYVHKYKCVLIKAARLRWNDEHVLLAHTEEDHYSAKNPLHDCLSLSFLSTEIPVVAAFVRMTKKVIE